MPTTFTLIASSTVGSGGAASIDFTSIPSTYTDLVLKCSVRNSVSSSKELWLNFNSSTANGSARVLSGNGSTASSYTATRIEGIGYTNGPATTSNTFTSVDFYIPNYAGSNNKSVSADAVNENNATLGYNELTASLWSNTAAITSISVVLAVAETFAQYSTAYLYGIKNS